MARLFSYNRPEWPYLIPAVLGALIDGAAMPLCTIALVGSMEGFFKEKEQMRQDLEPRPFGPGPKGPEMDENGAFFERNGRK